MTTPSSIAQRAAALILARDAAGQAKYGVSMDRGDLKPGQWLQHAIEEHADALQYELRLAQDLERLVREAYRAGKCDGRNGIDFADDADRIVRELLG